MTKDQEIIYNFFDWPSSPHAKMIIVGIANTMNLPEKMNSKILSRCGTNRLVFKPYTSDQINEIILSRIGDQEVFEKDSIDYLCKKISISSSDIRKTLHVCRKSVELAQQDFTNQEYSDIENRNFFKVTTDHVRKSYALLYCSPCHESISNFSSYQKIILISIAMDMKCSGENICFFSDVLPIIIQIVERFKSICIAHGIINTISSNEIFIMLKQMEVANIIEMAEKFWVKNRYHEGGFHRKENQFYNICDKTISLVINLDDLTNALKEDDLFIVIFNKVKNSEN